MKRIIAFFLLAFTAWCSFAQSRTEPQIAYRILSDYMLQKEARANDKAWTGVVLTVGGALMLGSAATWVFGDMVSEQVAPGNKVWSQDLKMVSTLVLAGSGVATASVGFIGVLAPLVDLRKEYSLVYRETDPVVQEALAVVALKEIADRGRDSRITGAVIGIATPLVTLAVQTIINVNTGKTWNHNYGSVGSWQIPSVISSATSLFSLSSEERMFEKYLAARSAIYAVQ